MIHIPTAGAVCFHKTVATHVHSMEEVMVCCRDLSVAWIDYQKAYDRIRHEWISWMLSFKAPISVQYVLANLRERWSSVFCVGTREDAVRIELTFHQGLFQGDSLSPLLFCISITPIFHALRKATEYSECNTWLLQLCTCFSWTT